jgi:phage/plasmid-associated DNA primase
VSFKELNEILDKYKYEHDVVQQYIDEVHETGFPNRPTKVSEIHELYVLFCNKHQEKRLSLTSFAKELIKKGYKKTVKKDGSYYDLGVVGGSVFTETFENNNL